MRLSRSCESVSPVPGKNGSVNYCRVGALAVVWCLFIHVNIGSAWGSATIGTLPEGLRPPSLIVVPFASDWASGSMSVASDGRVNINANSGTITTASSISAVAVFPVA